MFFDSLPDGVTVAQLPLEQFVGVQIPVGQPSILVRVIAQLARASACHAEGCGFNPRSSCQVL